MNAEPVVLGVGLLLTLGCMAVAVGGGSRRRIARRADMVRARVEGAAAAPRQGAVVLRRATAGSGLDALVWRILPRRSVLRERLARTGRDIGVGAYGLASLTLGLLAGLAMWRAAGFGPVPSLAAAVAVGLWVPHAMVGHLGRRRVAAFVAVFPDAIELMVRGLKSGLPISECVAVAGDEMAAPVGPEFRGVAEHVRLGTPLDDALWSVARRLDVPEFRFFVISLAVQRETGGNLAQTLANLAEVLRRRRQMALKVRAMSSEARASALILGGLPFLMFAVIYLLNPDYEMALFTDPRGRMMLSVVLGVLGVGIAIMRRMVRFEI